MNYLSLRVTSYPGYIDVNLFEIPLGVPDFIKNLSFMECMKNGKFELFPMMTNERHRGAGNLVLAAMYQELRRKGVKEVYAPSNMSQMYTDMEYEKYISQIGFKQTWMSYLFGGKKYYAKIPNPTGDAFVLDILGKYKFTTGTDREIPCHDYLEYLENMWKAGKDYMEYKVEKVNPTQPPTNGA